MTIYFQLKYFIKLFIPYGIMNIYNNYYYKKKESEKYNKISKIRNYFLNLNINEQSTEIVEIIDYLKNNTFSIFPYDYVKKYFAKHYEIFYNNLFKMYFVLYNNKKLYFPKGWNIDKVNNYYNELLIEQDIESPHRYETDSFTVNYEDTIADIGAAEGIWALTYIDIALRVYLFECENQWIEALYKTFEPWIDKVKIINKYISDTNYKNEITIDNYFNIIKVNFIKADIEGNELKLLKGGKKLLSENNNIKLVLCTYHKENNAIEIKKQLEEYGYTTDFSKRFIINIYDNDLNEPYIRKGIIRAKK